MAIQELEIHGYRSFKKATWRPGKLNLLVGTNGSGKSNLLRLLDLIHYAANGDLEATISAGEGMLPISWNHERGVLGWKLRLDHFDVAYDNSTEYLTYEFEIKSRRPVGDYRIVSDHLFCGDPVAAPNHSGESFAYFTRDRRRASVRDEERQELREISDYDELESLLSQTGFSASDELREITRGLASWSIYHALKVDDQSDARRPQSPQHTTRLDPYGLKLTPVLHTSYSNNPTFKQLIDDGMAAAFGSEFQELTFPVAGRGQIQLAIQWQSSADPHTSQELSDGTLRFLMILSILANPNPPPLIAIDEPETGLHPSMLPIIADYAIAASENTQVVISSHSPEFLDYFTEADPHVTVFQWEDAQSKIYDLPGETLSPWLKTFRLGEMFTSNELELLAQPPVEPLDNIDNRFADLPSEDETMPIPDVETGGDNGV